ncbi:hypothetical protein [Streptomyces sp. NPDC003077]|uniref:hypothetical protein n=1 Tax=Streptomyces sp. NPDC003077 TaxID=3154443 RepID=UPI0033BD65CC
MTSQAEEETRVNEPGPVNKKRRRLITGAVAFVCLMAAAGGAFYLTGGFDKWRDRQSFDEACQGVMDGDTVRSALGSDAVRAIPDGGAFIFGDNGKSIAQCHAKDREWEGGKDRERGVMTVDIRWASHAARANWGIHHIFANGYEGIGYPVGYGWRGSVVSNEEIVPVMRGAVELTCRNKSGERLLVATSQRGLTMDEAASDQYRTRFAQALTGTATNAAKKFGCDAELGKPVERVPSTAPYLELASKPLDRATGVCAPLAGMTPDARRQNAPLAAGSPKDPDSLAEDCFLIRGKGKRQFESVFRFMALYGRAAENIGKSEDGFDRYPGASGQRETATWATAQCPDHRKALYLAGTVGRGEPAVPSEADEFERKALRAFAQQSANEHGCTNLRTP